MHTTRDSTVFASCIGCAVSAVNARVIAEMVNGDDASYLTARSASRGAVIHLLETGIVYDTARHGSGEWHLKEGMQ